MSGSGKDQKFNQALAAGSSGNYRRAVQLLEECISESEVPPDAFLFLGRSFHALGNYSKALAAYNDYLRLKPRSAQGYFFAGRTYLSLGSPKRAVPLLKKALFFQPQNSNIKAFLGAAYLKSRHSAQAVEILEEAVHGDPENKRIYRAYLNALLIRGIRLCRLEEYELGIQMLMFVLENGTDGPLLRLELGRACRELGYPEEALHHYSAAVDFSPRDTAIRWYRASALMSLGRGAEAAQEIEYIRSLGGDLPNLPWSGELVDRFMIRAFMESKEWRRAADAARNWLKHRGPDAMIHTMYAESLRNMGDLKAAANHLERAAEIEPDEVHVWYERLIVAWEGSDWKTLGKSIKKLTALGGDAYTIKKYTVLLESKKSDTPEKALSALQNAIRKLGPDPELMYALGECCLQLGLIEEALRWFEKTRENWKHYERAYLGAIAAWEVLNEEGDKNARNNLGRAYDEYLSLWPDNRAIRRDWALYLVHICDFARASGELEYLLTWEPDNPTLRRVLAYAYRKNGRFREAAVFLKALLKERPEDVRLLLEYTGCLERAGAAKYAAAVLEKAMIFLKKTVEVPLALGLLFFREKNIERSFDMLREASARDNKDPRPYEWMAIIAEKTGNHGSASTYKKEAERRRKTRKSG